MCLRERMRVSENDIIYWSRDSNWRDLVENDQIWFGNLIFWNSAEKFAAVETDWNERLKKKKSDLYRPNIWCDFICEKCLASFSKQDMFMVVFMLVDN